MIRQLLKCAIVLMIGVSPIAHELCQLSCESPVAVAAVPSEHAHCAAAARVNAPDGAPVLESAPSACRNASDVQSVATIVGKAFAQSQPAVATALVDLTAIAAATHAFAVTRDHASPPVPARTQLRV